MKTMTRKLVKTGPLLAGAIVMSLMLVPSAQATTVLIGFNSTMGMGSGHATLTVGTDSLPHNANPPAGSIDSSEAQLITGASGTFTNSTIGTVTINGVLARNFATPFDMLASCTPTPTSGCWTTGDTPFPASFSQLTASGGEGGVVTYDNLFYPDGSPQTCWDYPFFGGFLDPYGVMFTLSNGGYLDLWSFGNVNDPSEASSVGLPPFVSGLTYGMSIIMPTTEGYEVLDGAPFATAAVPEPDSLWLFGAGLLGLFAWRRSLETRKKTSPIE